MPFNIVASCSEDCCVYIWKQTEVRWSSKHSTHSLLYHVFLRCSVMSVFASVSCLYSLQCHVCIRFSVMSVFASVSCLYSLQCHVCIRFLVISVFASLSCLYCHVFIISAAGSRYFSFKCFFYVLESLSPLLLYTPPISLSKAVNLQIAYSLIFSLPAVLFCAVQVCGVWTPTLMRTFEAPVWRVSWSITGNVLAVSTGE
jgi:hypothetical protein